MLGKELEPNLHDSNTNEFNTPATAGCYYVDRETHKQCRIAQRALLQCFLLFNRKMAVYSFLILRSEALCGLPN